MSSAYSSGTYTDIGSSPTGDATVNALIGGTKWGADGLGWGADITFSFPTSFSVGNSGWFSTGAFGYSGEKAAASQLFELVRS